LQENWLSFQFTLLEPKPQCSKGKEEVDSGCTQIHIWTCKHYHLSRLCPKISLATGNLHRYLTLCMFVVCAADPENSSWEDTECVADTPADGGDSQANHSLGSSQDAGFAPPSQGRNFRAGFSLEMPHADYVCSAPSAFGHTNVMYGRNSAVASPVQRPFTENHMPGYRNGGPGLNLNAHFY
jgi:hypothetical protein